MSPPTNVDALTATREHLRETYMATASTRPASTARGLHHTALISSDVEQTIRFYQGVLGFPLVKMFENRDYPGSTHFFFDIGHGNTIAFFDLPGLDLGPYREVIGGLHHVAISVEPDTWQVLRDRFDEQGIDYLLESEVSLYFTDPDGARLELIADPLGEMYGDQIL